MGFPYHSLIIDSSPSHFSKAISLCLSSREGDRQAVISKLEKLWTTQANSRRVLPCLSVRSGLDLYLQAQAYPHGSEVIMTAVNIQDVAQIIRHHELRVIPVDIAINTLGPTEKDLVKVITRKTVAILVAHLFGRWVDICPILAVANKYGLHVIEDCAEGFCGFSHLGHTSSDISLFSFGTIKYSTSFGGSIAKVRDVQIWKKMEAIQSQYPIQTNQTYLKKVLKYLLLYTLCYTWPIPHASQALYQVGFDPKELFVKHIRGFAQESLIDMIRQQPSPALLSTMLYTHTTFNPEAFSVSRAKGEYFLSRLKGVIIPVGMDVEVNNHWLFPVIVKNAEETVKHLNIFGVSAYTGSTQLALIEGDYAPRRPTHQGDATYNVSSAKGIDKAAYSNTTELSNTNKAGSSTSLVTGAAYKTDSTQVTNSTCFKKCRTQSSDLEIYSETSPASAKDARMNLQFLTRNRGNRGSHFKSHCFHDHPTPEARYLMDHVIYLPVNKWVPFRHLDKMATICSKVMMHDKQVFLQRSYNGWSDIRDKRVVVRSWQNSKL